MKTLILLSLSILTLSTSTPALVAQNRESTNQDVVAMLKEIVHIREQLLEGQMLALKAGSIADTSSSEIALAKARIKLAKAQDQPESVLLQLKKIVEILRVRVERAELRATDRVSPSELGQARINLLQAQVRLAKYKSNLDRKPAP